MKHSGEITTQHIAPIEIFPGSVTLETRVALETREDVFNAIGGDDGEYPKKHIFSESERIKFVRVIMFNDSRTSVIDAEYPSSGRGDIQIWVKPPFTSEADMKLRTGSDGKLQVEIKNGNYVFGDPQGGGTLTHPMKRRTYNEANTLLQKVRLTKPGMPYQDSTGQIVLIQIWTDASPE